MPFKLSKTPLPGVLLIDLDVHKDPRGFFIESYHHKKYAEIGIDRLFVQDNYSHSRKGIVRGLHYQLRHPQGKLVFVIKGEIFDVAVDIRRGSPTFGQWVGVHLSAENRRQIFIPEGFAHGFSVLSESVDVIYKCTDFHYPDDEYGIFWSDTTIGIKWCVNSPTLSVKDSKFQKLDEIPETNLPAYSG